MRRALKLFKSHDGEMRRKSRRAAGFPASMHHGLTLVLISWLCASCASTGIPFLRPAPTTDAPWQIQSNAFPTQRLYRIKYQGPEGELGFKLVLYLESKSRYRLLATDLGRKLWSLSVDGAGEAAWIDYRQKEFCQATSSSELRFVPLANLPLGSLPKLLLGRLPAEPAANLIQDATRVTFLDVQGQLWNASLAGSELEWWSLLENDEPVVWWKREADGSSVFVDRRGQQEVRWREVVSESLESSLAAVVIPAKFSPGNCDAATAR